ncbi:hypothetical protein C8Q73DRAFT_91868 [Cubamyces lactineus]|nr:hypothetical protein C8Q73DRAFT_91868 [Cubamyces lactineus]
MSTPWRGNRGRGRGGPSPNYIRGRGRGRGETAQPHRVYEPGKRHMELIASVSRSSGLEKDGDAQKIGCRAVTVRRRSARNSLAVQGWGRLVRIPREEISLLWGAGQCRW